IDYKSAAKVIVAVDTSHIAVGFYLCQCDLVNPKKWYFACFGSITLNDRESRFSQPKLELYGLFRALRTLKPYIIGVHNLVVEVDCRSIKGMLANPDLQPGASMNRWIIGILMFHFGLSRRPPQLGDEEEPYDNDDFDEWVDQTISTSGWTRRIGSSIS
ncbi:hypothetical protein BV22DRAFT_1026985, partial [Leucogyrophana mollusca]